MQQRKHINDSIRKLIISKYIALKPIFLIAEELELNPKSVSTIISVYKKTGRICSSIKSTGRKKKVTLEISNFVKSQIDIDISITLSKLRDKIIESFNLTLSTSSIFNMIDEFNYSFKRVELIPAARNTLENKTKRFQYAYEFTQVPDECMIFLDEYGISCSSRQAYGRSLRGTSPRKTVRAIRSQNISVSAAITRNKVYFFEYSFNAYNGEKYILFLTNLLSKLALENVSNRCFILDNVPFHKMTSIRELIENSGHRILFLPPYSPQLNPIENLFAKWKGLIKNANCNSQEQLLTTIRAASEQITINDCNGYFTNMMTFIGKAFNNEDF